MLPPDILRQRLTALRAQLADVAEQAKKEYDVPTHDPGFQRWRDETQALLDDEFPRAWQSTTFSALGFGGAHPVASSVLSGDQDYGELKIEQNALFDDGIENARQRLAEILDRLPTPPTVTAEVSVAERRSRQSPEVLPDSPGNGVFGKWIRPILITIISGVLLLLIGVGVNRIQQGGEEDSDGEGLQRPIATAPPVSRDESSEPSEAESREPVLQPESTGRFTFLPIVDNEDLPGLPTRASMNDAGTVAFIAPTDDAGAMDALFIADRAELTRAIDGGSRFVGMNYADINNSGTVVFHAEQDPSGDGSGVFSFAAGDLRTVIENGTPFGELLGIGPVLLNDDGVVAFVANVAPGATGQGIVTTDGNSITVVADESGIADMRLSSMYPFAVNDEGVVSPSRPK